MKIEVPSEDEDKFSDAKCDVIIDPSIVQVRADSEELNRRIQAFISRKREQVNLVNVQEFCFHGSVIINNLVCSNKISFPSIL